MIAKGTAHAHGGRLGLYLITGKGDERAELRELRGFADRDIVSAFRSVHVMADATNCKQPFFHCQVRNPDGEHMTWEQWQLAADRIEGKLGLTGQPRAIAFHERDGHEHMHVAWSRIDEESMTAKPLPFFKLRLKDVCRELEIELDLTRVRNTRAPAEPLAPKREEFEQAKRLELDPKVLRAEIRAAWESADNGPAFTQALRDRGFALARGDRRDYVVVDEGGGVHALGKRLVGQSAAEIRQRLADLDRNTVPTLDAARAQRGELKRQPAEAEAPKPRRVDIGFAGTAGARLAAGGPPDRRIKFNAQDKTEDPGPSPAPEIDTAPARVHATPKLEFFEDQAPAIAEQARRADAAAALEQRIEGMEAEQARKEAERAAFLLALEANEHERERRPER